MGAEDGGVLVAVLDPFAAFRNLGLSRAADAPGGFTIPQGASQEYLHSEDGARSMYDLYISQFDPYTQRVLRNQFPNVMNRWKAATALDQTMTFDKFLDQFDPRRYISQSLSNFERGTQPGIVSRGVGGYRMLTGI